MTLPLDIKQSSDELLERARLTLRAIQYRERASRYSAAAATLQAAMVHAENGNSKRLQEWMELESRHFEGDLDWHDREIVPLVESSELQNEPVRIIRIDGPVSDELAPAAQMPIPPWDRMDKAATARLASRFASSAVLEQESLPSKGVQPASVVASPEEGCITEDLQVAIACVDRDRDTSQTKHWWRVPHVWISLLVHGVLVVCLGLIALSVANEPKLLSIVSSSIEAENVLMETPMEMVSELESVSEPLQSVAPPALVELQTQVSIPELTIQSGALTSVQPSVSSAVAISVADSAHSAMMGSKMLAGAEFFGVKATGNTFVYIVDSSPSMRRDGAFEAARKEVLRSLSSMKPKQRYFVSFFGKEIDPMVFEHGVIERYPVYAKPENLTKTTNWLDRVQVQKEGLPPNNALTEAIAMQPDGIFLLFDGDTKVDVAKHLRRVNRSDDIINLGQPKIPIHVIHFFQDEFQKQMKQIADENSGTYRFVPRPERPSKGNR